MNSLNLTHYSIGRHPIDAGDDIRQPTRSAPGQHLHSIELSAGRDADDSSISGSNARDVGPVPVVIIVGPCARVGNVYTANDIEVRVVYVDAGVDDRDTNGTAIDFWVLEDSLCVNPVNTGGDWKY